MTLTMTTVMFDCADALAVAGFWSEALGRPIDDGATTDYASISGDGAGPALAFTRVPEGKAVKNRVHLDLHAADRGEEVERLEKLGARTIADHGDWVTLADVEGNELCVA